ncbi:hypothetical protein COT20_01710 [bacterium (Candidatus Gribaldobacteria) CG08_land_8_20_14_0_20_39_15]|uniref:Uncharacterized protein n=1 Tax=bacterium (Candidatus Gribaldobacteria) CG08_land_8_20_14_0_20_39_15 TaxID=2014273 RepID=A0A2M6XUF1_9BACT|nr:MAG: hypothetical protein COT20_01710 [bacterium (Candidatus Gribaldobacteria) CG08_land_8_20_14_0_20_39_15]
MAPDRPKTVILSRRRKISTSRTCINIGILHFVQNDKWQNLEFSDGLKAGGRKIKNVEKTFLLGGKRQRAAAGRSVSFVQKRFAHFQTKGTVLYIIKRNDFV